MRITFLLLSASALFILSISVQAEAKCSVDSDGNLIEPCGPPNTMPEKIDPIRYPFAFHDLVLVGNVISSTQRLSENQTIYYIDVEKYLKNPKPYDMITAIGNGTNNNTMEYYNDVDFYNRPIFNDGDKVFLYLTNDDGKYMVSPYSFAILKNSKCCIPTDDIMINPFALTYRPSETITMSGEVRKGQLYEEMQKNEDAVVTIQVHNSKNELIKNATAYIRPDGTFSHKIIIRDQVGDYGADAIFGSTTISDIIRIRQNVGCCGPLDKMEILTPLKQFKSGSDARDVICKESLQLVIKSSNGHPMCVKVESIAKLVSWNIINGEIPPEKYMSEDFTNNTQYTPPEVKDEIPNDYGLSIKFVSSDKGFFTGGVAPVGTDGSTAKTESHGLLYSTKKDVTVHKLFLCKSNDCIDSNGSMTFAYASMPGPGFLFFYDLNKVSWKEGDKVHIWAKASEGIYDSSTQDFPKTNWIDIGITTIEPCETYGFWCYPK